MYMIVTSWYDRLNYDSYFLTINRPLPIENTEKKSKSKIISRLSRKRCARPPKIIVCCGSMAWQGSGRINCLWLQTGSKEVFPILPISPCPRTAMLSHMEVSINGCPKWMVYDGWFRGTPFLGNLHIIEFPIIKVVQRKEVQKSWPDLHRDASGHTVLQRLHQGPNVFRERRGWLVLAVAI